MPSEGPLGSGPGGEGRPPAAEAPPRMDAPGSTPALRPAPARLHWLTPLFVLIKLARGLAIPAVILIVLGRDRLLGAVLLLTLAGPAVFGVIRYATFTYLLEGDEFITRQGILKRRERHIPFLRVQDIRIEQGVLHRLLGLADVHLDTAGGAGDEASLCVLALRDAERLRRRILTSKAGRREGAPVEGDGGPEQTPSIALRRVSVEELVLAGMSSNHLASAAAILAVAIGLMDDLLPPATYERLLGEWNRWFGRAAELSGPATWAAVAVAGCLVLLAGLAFSVAGSVLLYYGFTLSERGSNLHRSYGLLTRRMSSLPRRRIQVLKIEETWLRRMFGLATLKADTAGGGGESNADQRGGRNVLLPVVRRGEVAEQLRRILPDYNPSDTGWRLVSPKAIWRGTIRAALICAVAAGLLAWAEGSWWGLWPMAFIPAAYALNVASYRRLGYGLGDTYFRTRRGWLSRTGHIVPICNAQSVIIRRTPLDRRHGVATLLVDTAGQAYTGGGPEINNVVEKEALAVGWHLARQASRTRYRW